MPSVHDVLFWANRRAVAREITERGYRVSGETLNRWVRDRSEVPAIVERIVFELFGHEKTAPDVPERLDRIEGLVRAIAAATPGVQLDEVEQVIARVDELERSRPQPVESHQTDGPGTRGERAG